MNVENTPITPVTAGPEQTRPEMTWHNDPARAAAEKPHEHHVSGLQRAALGTLAGIALSASGERVLAKNVEAPTQPKVDASDQDQLTQNIFQHRQEVASQFVSTAPEARVSQTTETTLSPGWNLVSQTVTDNGPDYTLSQDGQSYDQVAGVEFGKGKWTYSDGTVTTPLSSEPTNPVTVVHANPEGGYTMLGNPYHTDAQVQGADALYTFDPGINSYQTATQLAAGQGAWAHANADMTITKVEQGKTTSDYIAELYDSAQNIAKVTGNTQALDAITLLQTYQKQGKINDHYRFSIQELSPTEWHLASDHADRRYPTTAWDLGYSLDGTAVSVHLQIRDDAIAQSNNDPNKNIGPLADVMGIADTIKIIGYNIDDAVNSGTFDPKTTSANVKTPVARVIMATVATQNEITYYRTMQPFFNTLGMNDSEAIASTSQQFLNIENQNLPPDQEFHQKALLINQLEGNIVPPQDQEQLRYNVIDIAAK